MENILDNITAFADKAHGEQQRKYTPERYIVHPVRVMKICKQVTDDVCVLAAALLHDVLEDTEVKKDELENYLLTLMKPAMAHRTVQLVKDLTDVYVKRDYPNLNRRTRKAKELLRLEKTNPDAQTIKYADIIDNSREIIVHDPDFAMVFLYECRANLRKMQKGNIKLYDDAMNTVIKAIEALNHT